MALGRGEVGRDFEERAMVGREEGSGGAELAPSKEMDPFIMCTEVGRRRGGARCSFRSIALLAPIGSGAAAAAVAFVCKYTQSILLRSDTRKGH